MWKVNWFTLPRENHNCHKTKLWPLHFFKLIRMICWMTVVGWNEIKTQNTSDVDEMSKLIKYLKREWGRQTGVEKRFFVGFLLFSCSSYRNRSLFFALTWNQAIVNLFARESFRSKNQKHNITSRVISHWSYTKGNSSGKVLLILRSK